ncbi:hypothetical protein ACIQBJ_18190 [Kitasatospora sp. NPDC088391]|uniref:hypothetical protein n=1 Tax=Kitasatospora sp. NPDC088391 TaxID=3364074 RepID=UPI003811657E
MALLWSLLLAALLALLPCTASARAATPEAAPSGQAAPGARTAVQGPSAAAPALVAVPTAPTADRPGPAKTGRAAHHAAPVAADAPGLPYVWCAVEGQGQRPGHGCSGHSFCGPDAHLPNAPPQPGPVVLPRSIAPSGAPAVAPRPAGAGSHHAPDLHVLQVHRS